MELYTVFSAPVELYTVFSDAKNPGQKPGQKSGQKSGQNLGQKSGGDRLITGGAGYYAQKLIVVRIFRVNLKNLTSKFWFSIALISKILV